MTPDEHDGELERNRNRNNITRSNESPTDRNARLTAALDRSRNRRYNETIEQTNERQQLDRQRHRTRYANDRATYFNTNVGFANRSANLDHAFHQPVSLGFRDKACSHCAALLFDHELRWKNSCCGKGDTVLPNECHLKPYPTQLFSLLQGQTNSSNFWEYIRRYNSAFAFASFGAQAIPPPGHGPYCFRIHGQTYHRTGLLHPEHDTTPSFAQIYILEGTGQLQARLNNNADCLPNI